MQGCDGEISPNFKLKSELNELSGLVRMSNIGRYFLSSVGSFNSLDQAKISCFGFPLPTNLPNIDDNPEPLDWDDDDDLDGLYNQDAVFFNGYAAGPERVAMGAYKLCPAEFEWILLMRIRGSLWQRVSDELQRIFLNHPPCLFWTRMLEQIKLIYELPFTLARQDALDRHFSQPAIPTRATWAAAQRLLYLLIILIVGYIGIYSVNRYSYSGLYLWPIADHFKHFFVLQRETGLTINNKGKHVFKCISPTKRRIGLLEKIPDQHGGF